MSEWIQCINCDRRYAIDEIRYTCECGGLLSIERDQLPKDVKGVIGKVAKAGYKEVETFGYDAKTGYWGLQSKDFAKLLKEAKDKGCILKFVASFDDGKASVGLQHIDPKHDLYHLYGKDNIVLFYTDRYKEQPMVVKGAGAGADVTASGVFADIIRTSR